MRGVQRCFAVMLSLTLALYTVSMSFGQVQPPIDTRTQAQKAPQTAEACGTCGACGTLGCGSGVGLMAVAAVFVVLVLVMNIALLVWVARDAKSRNMDSAILWMTLVFFTNWLGLVIYLGSRPQGSLMQCEECGNKRLQASRRCPHCGNA